MSRCVGASATLPGITLRKDIKMIKYVFKRLLLMVVALFCITTICFVMIRLLPMVPPEGSNANQEKIIQNIWEARGYNKPILVQYGIYLRDIFTEFDFGTSWKIKSTYEATEVFFPRLLPTILVNLYSFLFAVPIGLAFGIFAAIKKNKWQDHLISIMVMVFVSVPSYVYAFLVQYFFFFKLRWFPATIYSLADAGGSYLTGKMFFSMIPPILALSFGTIAGLTRFTRAELTETLTQDYMLLARTKGLTRSQATTRHALKNAMVPILPSIISGFIGILGGSMIIEQIFAIPGIGQLYIRAVQQLDYDVFMLDSIFYTFVSLLAGIVVDISYGFIDPRIRMGER